MSNGTIGGILFLCIIVLVIIIELKRYSDKKKVEDFINGLGDKILEIILETINDINPKGFSNLENFRNIVLQNIYSAVWDYVAYTAEDAVEVDQITRTVFKLIDKETVVDFIDNLEIDDLIAKAYNKKDIPELEEEVEEDYSDQTQYVEDVTEMELPPAEEKEIPEEELAKIIPPKDEEDENIDMEDDSMEIITDKKMIIKTMSKNGQELYYEVDENGKKSRVSKAYALEHVES